MNDNQPLATKTILLVLLLCVLWGGLTVSVKIGLEGVPPILLAALRFATALVCIFTWAKLTNISLHLETRDRRIIIVPSAILAAQIIFLNLGTDYTSASHGAIFMQSYPFFVATIAHYAIPTDRLTIKKILGLLLAGGGMVLTIYDDTIRNSSPFGDILVLCSAIFLAIQIVINKVLVRRILPVSLIFWQQVVVLPIFILLWIWTEWQLPIKINFNILTAIIYQGPIVAGFCFLVFVRLLQKHSATRISAFFFTTPLFGVLMSWLILGDQITSYLSGGLLLLGAGLWMVNQR
tara:strand:- start:102858 stop:103733 length:876 start_codon:yes stop_codon:yes gene_type:complete